MNKRKLELFKPEMLTEFYRKIFRDGSFAATAGDFWEPELSTESLAEALNGILNAQLGPMVTGAIEGSGIVQPFGEVSGAHDTHRAFPIGVEPIESPKSECVHEPLDNIELFTSEGISHVWAKECKHCGAELKPTKWEAVEGGK